MVQLDVVITHVLTSLYLFVGICIGWHLRASRSSPSIDRRNNFVRVDETRLTAAQEELEKIIHAVQQIHRAIGQPSPHMDAEDAAITQRVIDAANLAAEKWFPTAAAQTSPSGKEQRATRRFPFPHIQRIAPAVNDEMPEDCSFREAQFRDISTTGFSFYLPEEFDSERLVAKLGTGPDVVTVLAEVMYQHEAWHEGSWVFHVGCRILRRLSPKTRHDEDESNNPGFAHEPVPI
jgi:hypothetical protein